MPSARSVKPKSFGSGYSSDPMAASAKDFINIVGSINEATKTNFFHETSRAFANPITESTLRKYFMKESYDANQGVGVSTGKDPFMSTPAQIDEFNKERGYMFENCIDAIQEASIATNAINPMIGMALPMYKNILMNMVWDKGGIPHKTAEAAAFTRTMEIRELIDAQGNAVDMFLDQNKMTEMMLGSNPDVDVELENGEQYETEIVYAELGGAEGYDHIDRTACITAVKVKDVYFDEGEILPDENGDIPKTGGTAATGGTKGNKDVWVPVKIVFGPGYGEIKRQLQKEITMKIKRDPGDGTPVTYVVEDVIQANQKEDRFMVRAGKDIVAVRLTCKLDASMRTIKPPTVNWREVTEPVEIGTDTGIAVQVTPEALKDVKALYQIDQQTKLMSLMKTAMANRRDDKIKMDFMASYDRLPSGSKFAGTFDYAPRSGYVDDQIKWRTETFWDYFDSGVTKMLQVLNDPNMSVCCFGDPDLVRKITPKTYTYQAPASIGPVELDFSKTVVTSDRRVYSFIGSDKLRNTNQFIITLTPRNTNRIIYVIYDYQFYISNEIRDNDNPALPQIVCFDRFKVDEYQPIQGRLNIANPSGLRPGQSDTVVFDHVE